MAVQSGLQVPVSGSREPVPYTRGLTVKYASITTVILDAGSCSDSTNTIDITIPNALTIDATIVGAGGMDTGALEASKLNYLHIISSSSRSSRRLPSAVISKSKTAPALPYGYDASKMIGVVPTNGSAEIVAFYITGNGSDRKFTYVNAPNITLAAPGAFPTAYAALSLAAVIPPIDLVSNVEYILALTPLAGGNNIMLSMNGVNYHAVHSGSVAAVAAYGEAACPSVLLLDVPTIYYKLTSATDADVILDVKSFTFSV